MLYVIENPVEFYRKAMEIKRQCDGENGGFILIDDEKEKDFSKNVEVITDILSIEMNDKKILNALYKKLEGNFCNSELVVSLNSVNANAEALLQGLFSTVDISLSTKTACISDYLKIFDVKIEKTYDTFIEKIICYVNILAELKRTEVLTFVNARGFFSDSDLKLLLEHCEKEKIYLLFIESNICRELNEFEKATVITNDLCEIVVKSK